MRYKNNKITERAKESPLWEKLCDQSGEVLPYLLERYLLLENWMCLDRYEEEFGAHPKDYIVDEVRFVHLLIADLVTVVLNQEDRIRKLENKTEYNVPCL